jgi:hypothetical protein
MTLRQYLRPAFESYPLARIDVLAIRTWLARLEADGVGQATRAKAYRLLARILGAAVEARYIAVNPCGIRRAASDGAPEMRIATVDQVVAIANRVPARYRGRALATPESAGKRLDVHGPQAHTIADALRIYCQQLTPGTRVVTRPLWFMTVLDRTVLRGQLRGTLDLMRALQHSGERGDPSQANQLLGPPTTTLLQWCQQRRS